MDTPSQRNRRKRTLKERNATAVVLLEAFEEWVRQKCCYEDKRRKFKGVQGLSDKDFRVSSTHCGFAQHLLDCHRSGGICSFCWPPDEQVSCPTKIELITIPVSSCPPAAVDVSTQTEDTQTATVIKSTNAMPKGDVCPIEQRVQKQSTSSPTGQLAPAISIPKPVPSLSHTFRQTSPENFQPRLSPIPVPASAPGSYEDSDSEEEFIVSIAVD